MNMQSSSPEIKDVIDIFGRQQAQLHAMLEILRQEYDALKHNNLSEFERIIQEKHIQSKKLESLEKELEPVKRLLGGKLSKENMLRFIAQYPAKNLKIQLHDLWENFHSLLQQCQTQNKTNNRIIEASRSQLQQALGILRGEAPTTNIYGATGKQDIRHPRNHSIAVA